MMAYACAMTVTFIFSLIAAGVAVGVINVMAGGGSALTLPLMIFLGMDPSVANGTNRVAIIMQNISAIAKFKQDKTHDGSRSLRYGLMTLPGAILGAWYSVNIGAREFRIILGVVMILIVLSMLLPKVSEQNFKDLEKRKWLLWPAMFGIGLFGGFVQAGVGFLIMAALVHLAGESLVRTNIHKVFIVFIFTLPALLIFIVTDNVNWMAAILLSTGAMVGGWLGAHMTLNKGEKAIRIMLIVAMAIMAFRLFMPA